MRDLATDLLDALALLVVAAGVGLLVDAAVAGARATAGVGAGLVAAGLVVLAGSLVAHHRRAGAEPEGGTG